MGPASYTSGGLLYLQNKKPAHCLSTKRTLTQMEAYSKGNHTWT